MQDLDGMVASIRTTIPRIHVDLIDRPRVVSALRDAIAQRSVVLVCAPGGYGKTIAVSQALKQLPPGTKVAWLAASPRDSEFQWVQLVVAALEPMDLPWRVSSDALTALLETDDGPTRVADQIGQAMLNADLGRGVLVLDDVQAWAGDRINALMAALAEAIPERWSLVMVSREDPPLPLARMLLNRTLVEFREGALRLDLPEAAALAASATTPVTPAQLQQLLERTQGWIAGMSMALTAARGQGSIGAMAHRARRAMFDFLAEEVLASLPERLQQFLLRCSFLPELTVARCLAASGDVQTPKWLNELERRDLFVTSLDLPVQTLRIHDMFRDFLQHELSRRSPELRSQILATVARSEEDTHVAVTMLLQAGDLSGAEARLMSKAGLMMHGGGDQLAHLISQFPVDAAEQSPDLQYVKGLCAYHRFGFATVIRSMQLAAQGFDRSGRPQDALRARVLGLIASVSACRMDEAMRFWDPSRPAQMRPDTALLVAARDFAQALEAGPAEVPPKALADVVRLLSDSCPPEEWVFMFPPLFAFIGNINLFEGLTTLIDLLVKRAGQEYKALHAVAMELRAWEALWRCEFEQARTLASETESEVRWLGYMNNVFVPVRVLRAIDACVHGQHAEAQALAARLVDAANKSEERQPDLLLVQFQGMFAVAGQNWDLVRSTVARLRADLHKYRMVFLEVCMMILQAELDLHDGRIEQALEALREAAPAAALCERCGLHWRAAAALAEAEALSGSPAQAWENMAPIVNAARRTGQTLGLLLRGHDALERVSRAVGDVAPAQDREFLQCLVKESSTWQRGTSVTPVPTRIEVTPRELDVLLRLAEGQSNKQIARVLNLSPHTVKRHVARLLERTQLASRGALAHWYHGWAMDKADHSPKSA